MSLTGAVTLADAVKRLDPDGSVAMIAEIMARRNPVLQHLLWMEGNLPTGHQSTQRTGIPTPDKRLLNEGVSNGSSTTRQVVDTITMLEKFSEHDEFIANMNGNLAAFLLSEDRPMLQGFSQEIARQFFYGNTVTDPQEFTGLTPRFNVGQASRTNQDVASYNVIDGGGSGNDNASVWFVTHSEEVLTARYPKGQPVKLGSMPEAPGFESVAGISRDYLGRQVLFDSNNKKLMGHRTHYKAHLTLALHNWGGIARVCNIDKSLLAANANNEQKALTDAMIDACIAIEESAVGLDDDVRIYCGAAVKSAMDKYAKDKGNVYYQPMEWGGRPTTSFQGKPVFLCSALNVDESAVTFS